MKCKTLRIPMAEGVKRLAVRTLEKAPSWREKGYESVLTRIYSDGNKLTTVRSSDVICDTTRFDSEDDYRTSCRNVSHSQQQS